MQRFRQQDIKFADGEIYRDIDLSEFYEKVDFFASSYGLGSNRTLSDYAKMIDEEDPIVLYGLTRAALIRIRASHGLETKDEIGDIFTSKTERYVEKENRGADNKGMLTRFLLDFGASKDEIKLAEEKLKNMKVPEEDFSWITPEKLISPDFDFKGTLRRMNDCNKRSVNVNVSLDTLEKKRKNG